MTETRGHDGTAPLLNLPWETTTRAALLGPPCGLKDANSRSRPSPLSGACTREQYESSGEKEGSAVRMHSLIRHYQNYDDQQSALRGRPIDPAYRTL